MATASRRKFVYFTLKDKPQPIFEQYRLTQKEKERNTNEKK